MTASRCPLYLVEDERVEDLRPLVDLRAAHRLMIGAFRTWDRAHTAARRAPDGVIVRAALVAREREITDVLVTSDIRSLPREGAPRIVLLSGRAVLLEPLDAFLHVQEDAALWAGDEPVALAIAPDRARDLAAPHTDDPWRAPVREETWRALAASLPRHETRAEVVRYPWDVLSATYRVLASDLGALDERGAHRGEVHRTAVVENARDVTIMDGARIDPFVVLDGRDGPILIGAGAVIRSHVRITGPAIIGRQTHIVHGVMHSGTVAGANCRLGGEIAECVFLGFSNKSHEGFLGNSVVGPWVNLGALTTTSNLKNTYGPIKMAVGERRVNSGLTKLGSIIGDHTKTAIGTLLGTGTVLGVASNVFGGGQLAASRVPAFVWGTGPGAGEYAVDRALSTARTVMGRRSIEMTPAEEALVSAVFARTARERAAFLGRTVPHA